MANRKHHPHLLDYSLWATVNVDLLEEEDRRRYLRLEPAVKAACDRIKTGVIMERFGVSASHITYLLDRCTSMDPDDGRLRGFRALVRTSQNARYVRKSELNPDKNGHGLAGAFHKLLDECPKARQWLHARLKPGGGTRYQAAGLPLFVIHQDFLDELRKHGRTADQYPFNVKRQGYEALCSYVKALIESGDTDAAIARFGKHALDGKDRNASKRSFFDPIVSFERAATDEWELPAIGTLTIVIGDEEVEVPLERSFFCPIVDFRQFAVLGWALTVPGRFNRFDVLHAFECAIAPPKRKRPKIFADLPKLNGQGLPALVVPHARGCRISSLTLDNHMVHLANDVLRGLRRRTGVIISFGQVKRWITRFVVEGLFSELQRRIGTVASTTGSGPDDPAVDDPVGKAVRYKITIGALRDLLGELVDQHNASRRRALFSATSNEVIARDCNPSQRFSILPRWSEEFMRDPKIAIEREYPTVRGNLATGAHPYVELDGEEYTNNVLMQSWEMIGHVLEIQIRGDFRTVKAFRMDGTEFGDLTVSGKYSKTPHTRDTRKAINKAVKADQFMRRATDPVRHYQNKQAEVALAAAKGQRRPKITKAGGRLFASLQVNANPANPPGVKYPVKVPQPAKSIKAKPRNRRERFGKGGSSDV